ncbi:MAG: hypothetical protein ACYTGB_14445 [Planctomycetota bacterium]|jgi:hypothetical protein
MRCLLAVLTVAGLVTALEGRAGEWTSTFYDCGVTIPAEAGWTEDKEEVEPGVPLVLVDATGSRRMILVIEDCRGEVIDSASIAEIEENLLEGQTKIHGRRMTIGGLPAYELAVRTRVPAGEVTTIFRTVIGNDRLYGISVSMLGGDCTTDKLCLDAIAGFRFLSPPKPPTRSSFGTGVGGTIAMVLVIALVIGARLFIRRMVDKPLQPRTRRRGTFGESSAPGEGRPAVRSRSRAGARRRRR